MPQIDQQPSKLVRCLPLDEVADRAPDARSWPGRAAHAALVVVLVALGLWHLMFALVNFGYIEKLPDNLDVLVEGIAAFGAGASLLWAAARQFQKRRWGAIALAGACVFALGMGVSVASGASTPEMFQVIVPALLIAGIRLVVEARARTPGPAPSNNEA
jgi:peptidoglycan/LPS O-acetylase OafA/YrhL